MSAPPATTDDLHRLGFERFWVRPDGSLVTEADALNEVTEALEEVAEEAARQ